MSEYPIDRRAEMAQQICHLDRSEAQWRDLCVDAPSWKCFSTERTQISYLAALTRPRVERSAVSFRLARIRQLLINQLAYRMQQEFMTLLDARCYLSPN